ncbi:hypothetical protein OP172_003663 [Salmonella enterica subsp. enterica]|nr:hypothetical protein [Salmonella enterica subsp. enterica serovar Give]EKC4739340.1 hypothetical protein [Salmonella enterica subsp. enterica]EKC5118731.1 hypothetical protein [Salmonella enterica subsp. enterica]
MPFSLSFIPQLLYPSRHGRNTHIHSTGRSYNGVVLVRGQQHSLELSLEDIKLAERTGVVAAARELSLYGSLLYNWRSKR